MSTPQTYTITEDGIYRTSDGSKAYSYTAGTVIPMSLAIAMGLEGAGYDDPVYFTESEQAAIRTTVGDPYPWMETCDVVQANSASNVGTANTLHLFRCPRRLTPLSVAKIRFVPAAKSGGENVRAGIWSYDGTTWTLEGASASTAAGTVAVEQVVTVPTPPTIEPGLDYYLGLTASATTVTFQRTGSNLPGMLAAGPGGPQVIAKAGSFDLETNAASFTAADLTTPLTVVFWLRGSAT